MKLSDKAKKRVWALIFATLAVACLTGLTLVWMQQQIGRVAERARELERELEEVDRRLGRVDERIAKLHQPLFLQGKVAGRLRPAADAQIRYATLRSTPEGAAYVAVAPYEASMDLAFMDFENRRQR